MIAQRFEVPADSRLWKLEDRSNLVYGQLVTLEKEQEPAPRGIRESRHPIENRRSLLV